MVRETLIILSNKILIEVSGVLIDVKYLVMNFLNPLCLSASFLHFLLALLLSYIFLVLKLITCLQHSDCNTAKRLASVDVFYKLYKNCYPVPYSQECTGKLIDFVQKLSQSVPVYEYACLADESAVRYLERILCPILQSL